MSGNNGGIPRELRSPLIYAAAAANAWLRGLSLPVVVLHYRYEPVTALLLIRRFCAQYGRVHVAADVPARIIDLALDSERWLDHGGRAAGSVAHRSRAAPLR